MLYTIYAFIYSNNQATKNLFFKQYKIITPTKFYITILTTVHLNLKLLYWLGCVLQRRFPGKFLGVVSTREIEKDRYRDE